MTESDVMPWLLALMGFGLAVAFLALIPMAIKEWKDLLK